MVQKAFNFALNFVLDGLEELTKYSEVAKKFKVNVKIINTVKEGQFAGLANAANVVLTDMAGTAKRCTVVLEDEPADVTFTIKVEGEKLIISFESPFMETEPFDEDELEFTKFLRKSFRGLEAMMGGDLPTADVEVKTDETTTTKQMSYCEDLFGRKIYPVINGVTINKMKSELKKK